MREEVQEFGVATYDRPAAGLPVGRIMPVAYAADPTSGGALQMSPLAGWVLEAARKLEALGRLPPGWDSYGAKPLDPDARRLTLYVLGWLGTKELPVPAVALASGGAVHLEWHSAGKELDVGLGEGAGIEYVKVHPSGEIEEGTAEVDLQRRMRDLTKWLLIG